MASRSGQAWQHDPNLVQLVPAATRRVGDSLLVSTGAGQPVRRLGWSGAMIWEVLEAGAGLDEIVTMITAATAAPAPTVESHVLGFVNALCALGLATVGDR